MEIQVTQIEKERRWSLFWRKNKMAKILLNDDSNLRQIIKKNTEHDYLIKKHT